MCWQALIGMGAQAGQSALQGEQDANTLNNNAELLDMKVDDARKRGGIAEDIQRAKTAQTMGFQRSAMGASGVQVDSGSFGKVEEQTAAMGELDAQTIRSNAMREAWGYETEAANARAQAVAAGQMQRLLLPGTENGKFTFGTFLPNGNLLKSSTGYLGGGQMKSGLDSRANYISTGKY